MYEYLPLYALFLSVFFFPGKIREKTVEEIELDSSENDTVPIPKHCWNITTQHAVNMLMPDSVDYVEKSTEYIWRKKTMNATFLSK